MTLFNSLSQFRHIALKVGGVVALLVAIPLVATIGLAFLGLFLVIALAATLYVKFTGKSPVFVYQKGEGANPSASHRPDPSARQQYDIDL